ncbi:MAG: hypothetical protein AAF541_22755 [Pseudomonadota bacterium]
MPKSAREQLAQEKASKKVVLDKDFAGIKAGQRMLVATPQMVDQFIAGIPPGQTMTIVELREALAASQGCDATCPVSTAIFIRIVAQAAVDEMAEGATVSEVTPFWRLLDSQEKIAKKLTVDPHWLDHQRALEASA